MLLHSLAGYNFIPATTPQKARKKFMSGKIATFLDNSIR
jgi:hypothetical protein